MEKLKLRNYQLERENALLKSELMRMAAFSKRMVEITAEMDDLLNQRTNEIQKLKQQLKFSANFNQSNNVDLMENTLCTTNEITLHRPTNISCPNAPISERNSVMSLPNSQANSEEDKDGGEDNDLNDFTIELDVITEIKKENGKERDENKTKVPKRRKIKKNISGHNYEVDEKGYYKCPHCPRSLKQSSNLRAHVMIHTGEKPWKCKYCDERFTQSGDRGLHMRRVHCDILGTVKCNFCKRYFDPKKLNAHIQKSHPKLASKLVAN